jgi:Mlc titration factor MtfA (ptsG expression regulator)
MFEWWRERQREKILARAFPAEHAALLERNIKLYSRLAPDTQQRLRDLIQVFIAEKHWEGCGGLALTDEMRVTIAAQACLLVLELPHRMYENVESILVYPSTVVRPAERQGIFTHSSGRIASGPMALLGEAHLGGPVILAWDRVLRDTARPCDGYNLVYHEFAHKLDMLDGRADGTPPFASRDELQRWQTVCERVFLDLRARSERGEETFIDPYGAIAEAEFFAVVTEHFFEKPVELRAIEPELYEVFSAFYRQNPAACCDAYDCREPMVED